MLATGVLVFSVTLLAVGTDGGNVPRVCIADGCMRGSWRRTLTSQLFEAYIGIPFAKPPIGKLRFADPVPNKPWKDELDATGRLPKPACIQQNLFIPERGIEGSEDCLYLNVYRPRPIVNGSHSEPLSTLVYIHGGGFLAGYISPLVVGPEKLIDQRVIVVVIPYRLGPFGFLSTGDAAASGNFGLKDQRLALRWVNKHIREFGGDPQLVTIFGHSAGGASVQLHLMHQGNEGLFQRAISLSGSALAPFSTPLEDPLKLAHQQAALVGISDPSSMSTTDLVERLRSIDADLFVSSLAAFSNGSRYPTIVYGPVIESSTVKDPFLTDAPLKLWAEGSYLPVPWLTGIVPNDGFIFSAPILKNADCSPEKIAQQQQLLLQVLKGTKNPRSALLLLERFFDKQPSKANQCITQDNIDTITRIFNEASFVYPLIRSVQLRKSDNNTLSPVFLYKFNYKGSLSYSSVFYPEGDETRDYGIVHCDELIYIFRAPLLFPDFRRNTPDAKVSERFTKFMVDFARKGYIDEEKPNKTFTTRDAKKTQLPEALEFVNSNNTNEIVVERKIDLLDQEMVDFWVDFYSF